MIIKQSGFSDTNPGNNQPGLKILVCFGIILLAYLGIGFSTQMSGPSIIRQNLVQKIQVFSKIPAPRPKPILEPDIEKMTFRHPYQSQAAQPTGASNMEKK